MNNKYYKQLEKEVKQYVKGIEQNEIQVSKDLTFAFCIDFKFSGTVYQVPVFYFNKQKDLAIDSKGVSVGASLITTSSDELPFYILIDKVFDAFPNNIFKQYALYHELGHLRDILTADMTNKVYSELYESNPALYEKRCDSYAIDRLSLEYPKNLVEAQLKQGIKLMHSIVPLPISRMFPFQLKYVKFRLSTLSGGLNF